MTRRAGPPALAPLRTGGVKKRPGLPPVRRGNPGRWIRLGESHERCHQTQQLGESPVMERGTVIHSSKSRGGVVETALTAKAGWNGLGAHRMIGAEGSGDKSADGERAGSAEYGRVIVCAGGGLRMRVKPNGRYMQMIPDGTRLAVLEEKDGWLRTVYRGHTGWISGTYCCKAGED